MGPRPRALVPGYSCPMRAFAILTGPLVDEAGAVRQGWLINLKDAYMPTKWKEARFRHGLFGGGMEPGETPGETCARELAEELPGWPAPSLSELDTPGTVHRYVLGRVDLGLASFRAAMRACEEGVPFVVDEEWIQRTVESDWLAPEMRAVLLATRG